MGLDLGLESDIAKEHANVLTADALDFVAGLQRTHGRELSDLLQRRETAQAGYDQGNFPRFLEGPEYSHVHGGDWRVSEAPKDLQKRWVEITGPASSRKMVVNALNSGSNTFMADAEDSESPTLANIVGGQKNLFDAIRRKIDFTDEDRGKKYSLNGNTATLIFRPRGLHLQEAHRLVDGQPVSASLFDFGLYLFHNAQELVKNGSGPYFYLPKLQSHLEARLWNNVFNTAQDSLGIPRGTIKATALIETLPAAFEMEEMLFEMKEHIVGLNCGRWDYIFSYIKTLANHKEFVLPDRSEITMDKGFLEAYVKRLIRICHNRGAYAMGGMAAQIPTKDDLEAAQALGFFQAGNLDEVIDKYKHTWVGKVLADKLREARAGHDGTWIAHPGLREVAMAAFKSVLGDKPNQLYLLPEGKITENDLLRPPTGGNITYQGLYNNIRVGIEYMAAWLQGNGCVPLNNLMEDAATAEICRTQIWQLMKHGAKLKDGRQVDYNLFINTLDRVMSDIRTESNLKISEYIAKRYEDTRTLLINSIASEKIEPFMTIPAYGKLMQLEKTFKNPLLII